MVSTPNNPSPSNTTTVTSIGYQAIVEQLSLRTLPHYYQSYITQQGRGKTITTDYNQINTYPKTYALKNPSDLLENLEFALKHEGMNFEIIRALFEKVEKDRLVKYIQAQPTGIYSRKIWYLYEFLMEDRLPLPDCQRLKYIDLLNPKLYFTSSGIKSPRHAIHDNLLGNSTFCPFIRRTKTLMNYINLNLDQKVQKILAKYDPRLVNRTANYLYTKETMSSYQIEKEQPTKNRMLHFIDLLQHALNIEKFSKEKLIELQNAIVDPRFKDFDYRNTQNYVGENINPYLQKIHYISPKPEDVASLMQGLLNCLERGLAAKVHPVIVAAAISFGFVFIHPFEDGNGRIHRFLIHSILARQGYTPSNMIFPISALMLSNMYAYDTALESFSKPLLSVLTHYDLTDDGLMTVRQESKSYYQYIDFTAMAEYLFSCIAETIEHYIEKEIKFIANYDNTKKSIQEIVDLPNRHIDLFIKFIMQNNGNLAMSKRHRFFPELTDEEIKNITTIIRNIMLNQ